MKKHILIFFLLFINSANAALKVTVNGGDFKPINITVKTFTGNPNIGNLLKKIIVNDLENSGLFNVNAENSVNSYKLSGIITKKSNELAINYNLENIALKQILLSKKITIANTNYRYVAHKIADNIYTKLTGEKGYFTSKILFIDESGNLSDPVKKIGLMDQDGSNLTYLTNGNQLVVSPKFSNDNKEIIYTGYVNDMPLTYVQNIKTGERKIIGLFNNGTIAPTFYPNASKIIVSALKENGNSNLFSIDRETNNLKRLTFTNSIDAVSSFSPDGSKLVFSSDRTGRQKLYIMNIDGTNLELISKNKGSYSTPSWSPSGAYIAFTKKTPAGFSIGIMRPDGSDERILTTSFHNERPCWAPNGRLLMFFKEVSPSVHKLYSIDIGGHKEHLIPTPNGASDPDWNYL